MPDVFLFRGETSPDDVKLRDPTFVAIDATASGDAVVVTASLIDGAATGAAQAAGGLLSLSDIEIDGAESGAGTASGDTVLVTAGILAGIADGAVGSIEDGPGALAGGGGRAPSISAVAPGATIGSIAGLIPGSASGDGFAAGTVRRGRVLLFRGTASGEIRWTNYDNDFLIAA